MSLVEQKVYSIKTADDVLISIKYFNASCEHLIIIAPGFYNSKDALLMNDLALELSRDFDVMVMDFRGHGQSQGLFHWTSKEYLDVLAVLEHVKAKYKAIGLIGFSLGAATSIITASKTTLIKSLIAVSPPADFDKIEFRWWELNPENDLRYSLVGEGRIGKGVKPGPFWLPKERPIDLVGKLSQPILFIHGTEDWIIKPWHSKELYQKTNSTKRLEIIEGGPHAEYLMRNFQKELLEMIRSWMNKTL